MPGTNNQKTAVLVHGIHKKTGHTVEKLQTFLEADGYYVVHFDYGWTGILGAKFGNSHRAKKLYETIDNARRSSGYAVAIGHSNGCAVIHQSMYDYATPIDHAVYIAPALNPQLALPASGKAATYWYSKSDRAVQWPKRLRLIDPRIWGDAGAVGYQGAEDSRVRSYNKEDGFAVSSPGHSSVFSEPEELAYFGPQIVADIEATRYRVQGA